MRGNRKRETPAEIALRGNLHRRGFRFRIAVPLEVGSLIVRPDIVFGRQRVAVFVDGCFWHSCPVHGTAPKVNTDYWLPKLSRVTRRDRRVEEAPASVGWRIIRVWEHRDREEAAEEIEAAVGYS